MADSIRDALAGHAASHAQAAANNTIDIVAQSKIALCGLALGFSGFFGIFGVITLHVQAAIISAYQLLFGVTLVCFAVGAQNELLAKYFGFVYRPNGQLALLLVAGNLAWSTGLLGILAALFTNSVAFASWYAATKEAGWTSRGGNAGSMGGAAAATGMVDVDNDELL